MGEGRDVMGGDGMNKGMRSNICRGEKMVNWLILQMHMEKHMSVEGMA